MIEVQDNRVRQLTFPKGLSRVMGNHHARFLGEPGGSNAPSLPGEEIDLLPADVNIDDMEDGIDFGMF